MCSSVSSSTRTALLRIFDLFSDKNHFNYCESNSVRFSQKVKKIIDDLMHLNAFWVDSFRVPHLTFGMIIGPKATDWIRKIECEGDGKLCSKRIQSLPFDWTINKSAGVHQFIDERIHLNALFEMPWTSWVKKKRQRTEEIRTFFSLNEPLILKLMGNPICMCVCHAHTNTANVIKSI